VTPGSEDRRQFDMTNVTAPWHRQAIVLWRP
jgi:hypothetical protein